MNLENHEQEPDLATYGTAVKALGDGKISGYLVIFSTKSAPDLTGEFFTADTDFDLERSDKTSIYYHHGLDKTLQKRKLGEGTMKADTVGIWIDAQLNLRDKYEEAVYKMAQDGKLGWSSGSVNFLTERKQAGKAVEITKWPLGIDATLTPIPCEPRAETVSIKSLAVTDIEDAMKAGSTQADKRKDLSDALRSAKLDGYLEDYDDDHCYCSNYSDYSGSGYCAVPYTYKSGNVKLGEKFPVRRQVVWNPTTNLTGKCLSLADHSEAVLTTAKGFLTRAKAIHQLRTDQDRTPLSESAKASVQSVYDAIGELLTPLPAASEDDAQKAISARAALELALAI